MDALHLAHERPQLEGSTLKLRGKSVRSVETSAMSEPHGYPAEVPTNAALRVRPSEQPALDGIEPPARGATNEPAGTETGESAADALDATLWSLYRARAFEPGTPNPHRDRSGFLSWAAGADLPGPVPVSRYLAEIRRNRKDLLDAFPEVPGNDTDRYVEWAREHGRIEVPIPDLFVPPAPPRTAPPYVQPGVNLAGFLGADLGVGEVARRLAAALESAGVPHALVTHTRTKSRQAVAARSDEPRFDTNVVCINADSIGEFMHERGRGFREGRYQVGVWFWEADRFADIFRPAFANVDELWAASDYIADALAAAAPPHIPVIRMPLPVLAPKRSTARRKDFGLPDDVPIFVCSFDFLSVVDRKNPLGTIEAFKRCFPPDEGPILVIKSINGHERPGELERLLLAARGRRDIVIRDGYLSADDNAALLQMADCVVSLHRSEGFGFNLADAIALGTPVVATGYSGNLTFMHDDDTLLVRSHEVAIGEGRFPYPADGRWAEPDLDHAAELMRHVVDDPVAARRRATAARDRVLTEFDVAKTGTWIRDRLALVRSSRGANAPGSSRNRRSAATSLGRARRRN
jgi:glycosyltransferase involved in cell wall biosynthesis